MREAGRVTLEVDIGSASPGPRTDGACSARRAGPPDSVRIVAVSKTVPAARVPGRGSGRSGRLRREQGPGGPTEDPATADNGYGGIWSVTCSRTRRERRPSRLPASTRWTAGSAGTAWRRRRPRRERRRRICSSRSIWAANRPSTARLPTWCASCWIAPGRCRSARVVGLMTLPPFTEDPEAGRPFFRRLREIREQLAGPGASAGDRRASCRWA